MNRSLVVGIILAFLLSTQTSAATDRILKESNSELLVTENAIAGQWMNQISDMNPFFSEWKDATVHLLYSENQNSLQQDPLHVSVWTVDKGERNLGYFVTSANGQDLVEFSPITPVSMRLDSSNGTYFYAGPGMHLFQSKETPTEWRNLTNNEVLPKGIPLRHLPVKDEIPLAQNNSALSYQTEVDSGRGLAVMIGHSLHQSAPFDVGQLPAEGEAGYLVYTVVDQDYYSVWAITGLQYLHVKKPSLTPGSNERTLRFLEIKDVFLEDHYPLYIAANVPVNWVGSK